MFISRKFLTKNEISNFLEEIDCNNELPDGEDFEIAVLPPLKVDDISDEEDIDDNIQNDGVNNLPEDVAGILELQWNDQNVEDAPIEKDKIFVGKWRNKPPKKLVQPLDLSEINCKKIHEEHGKFLIFNDKQWHT